jgi:fido (protein-threonine AMPylation protein)
MPHNPSGRKSPIPRALKYAGLGPQFTSASNAPITPYLENTLGITSRAQIEYEETVRCPSAIVAAVNRLARQSEGWGEIGGPKKIRMAHQMVFGSLYPWAGHFRTTRILKTTEFTPPELIDKLVGQVFGGFSRAHAVGGDLAQGFRELSAYELANSFATLYLDLNTIHPFREGNGRAFKVICSALAKQANHDIRWQDLAVRKEALVQACIDGYRLRNGKLFYGGPTAKTERNDPSLALAALFRDIVVSRQPTLERDITQSLGKAALRPPASLFPRPRAPFAPNIP